MPVSAHRISSTACVTPITAPSSELIYSNINSQTVTSILTFPGQLITDWNSFPDLNTNIIEPEAFKLSLQQHLASPRATTKINTKHHPTQTPSFLTPIRSVFHVVHYSRLRSQLIITILQYEVYWDPGQGKVITHSVIHCNYNFYYIKLIICTKDIIYQCSINLCK